MRRLRGYLATLDVLGFSEMLQRESYSEQLKNYIKCLDEVIQPESTECVVFSDSIVITSPGDNDEAFRNVIRTCSAAFRALLRNEFPVRGAVAFGNYWREARDGSVFLAGRPIVEAYRCERSSDWVGILLCPSVIRQQPELDNIVSSLPDVSALQGLDGVTFKELDESFGDLTLPLRIQAATVPFLDSDTRTVEKLEGYAVVPLDLDDDILTVTRTLSSSRGTLKELRLQASQPRAQEKYRATLEWLGEIYKRTARLAHLYRRAKRREQTDAS